MWDKYYFYKENRGGKSIWESDFMKSLQTKLLVFTFGALLIFGVILGSVAHVSMHDVIDDDSDRILDKYCLAEKEIVNNTLESIEQSVNIVASTIYDEFEGLSVLESQEKYQAFSDYVKEMFMQTSMHTENSSSFYFRYNYELTNSKAGFYYGIRDNNLITYEPTEIPLYSEDDISHTGWYYYPIIAQKAVWVEPYVSSYSNMEMISYSVPIYYEGTFIAVVGMELDFSIIVNTVNSIDVYGEGSAYLTDTDGKIIYHSNLEKGSSKPMLTSTYTESEATLANGMNLVLGVERTAITGHSHSILQNMIYAIIVFILIAMLGMYIITKSITHPLKELTDAAKKVEAGDFNIELYHPSLDEVGLLSRSFQKTVDTLNEKIEFINKLAYTDSLTGLYNNTAYTDHTVQIEKNIHEKKFALIIFDVNDLKKINDEYGHEKGNELIITASAFIQNTFRNSNAYRIGGDEFAVILEGDNYRKCDDLLRSFDEGIINQYINVGTGKIKINVARGMAEFLPANDYKFDDVFKRADKAMYVNKKEIKSHKKHS